MNTKAKYLLILAFVLRSSLSFAAEYSISQDRIQTASQEEFCDVITEGSSPTFLMRNSGAPKQKLIEMQKGMSDPASIDLTNKVIDYAYSQPVTTPVSELKNGFKKYCLSGALNP